MKNAVVFPGQGTQYPGMGRVLFDTYPVVRTLFGQADRILGFPLSRVMFSGSAEELKETRVTQPAIFLHSVSAFLCHPELKPDMVAGHSLGEFSALVANQTLDFEDALRLVMIRAEAMQKACERQPSVMAAILGLEDAIVEEICAGIRDEVVVPANYNCPGQVVISGSIPGVERACQLMKDAGARKTILLPVGGAFHSPLMAPARKELKAGIEYTLFRQPLCPVYQNIVAEAVSDPEQIRKNLVDQLTGPVRWTQSVQAMIRDGAGIFLEAGPGKILQGLILKVEPGLRVSGLN